MTKDQLQKELLKKVKEGIKPSDLKKPRVKNNFDEGYESDSSVKTAQTKTPLKKDQIKQLQAQVKFEANKAQSYLTELQSTLAELDQAQQEIQELKKRKPETISQVVEQALMEANQKIRQLIKTNEDLQAKNQTLNKTISNLKEQAKTLTKTLPPPPEPKQYLFTCDICQQNKRSQLHLSRVNGLGIDPHKQNKICDYCLKKVDIIQEKKEEFF